MVNIAFFMIFAVFDPSPLTVCINCSFFTFIMYMSKVIVIQRSVILSVRQFYDTMGMRVGMICMSAVFDVIH